MGNSTEKGEGPKEIRENFVDPSGSLKFGLTVQNFFNKSFLLRGVNAN